MSKVLTVGASRLRLLLLSHLIGPYYLNNLNYRKENNKGEKEDY